MYPRRNQQGMSMETICFGEEVTQGSCQTQAVKQLSSVKYTQEFRDLAVPLPLSIKMPKRQPTTEDVEGGGAKTITLQSYHSVSTRLPCLGGASSRSAARCQVEQKLGSCLICTITRLTQIRPVADGSACIVQS